MRSTRKRLALLAGVIAVVAAIAVPVALAVTALGSLTDTDKTMTDRLFRDGVHSTCAGKHNPGIFGDGLARRYDSYSFTNGTEQTQCVHVFLSTNDCGVEAFAQANGPFVPAAPSHNYLGDAGQSASPQSFTFSVPAAQVYDVVVGQVNPGPISCHYKLTVTTIGGARQSPSSVTTFKAGATD
jgi:hypothetical protein